MTHPPIHFVISAPRSGSTWLANALNHHPDVFATEHRLFGDFAEIWKNNNGTASPRITFDSYAKTLSGHYFYKEFGVNRFEFANEFMQSYVQFACEFALKRTGKSVVVDKITPYPGTAKLVIEKIRKLFPGSKIIQLVRDGRDVLTSGTFDWLLKDAEATDRHAFFVDKSLPRLGRFFDDGVIEKWAKNWTETLEIFEPLSADHDVRYESMNEDLAGQLMGVFEAIGVESNPAIGKVCQAGSTFQKVAGRPAGTHDPTAKARKGVVGDWHNYFTRQDATRFIDTTGNWLTKMGYEPDQSWVDSCPDELNLVHP